MRHLTAVVLAGGKGSRMAPLSAPKCLVPVNGVPVLHRLLDYLSAYVQKIVVCTGYKGSDVWNSIRHRDGRPTIADHLGEEIDIAERIVHALEFVDDLALVCYGDELADVNVERLVRHHEAEKAWATVTVFQPELPFGVVKIAEGEVVGFEERPTYEGWVNIGFTVLDNAAAMELCGSELGKLAWPNYLNSLARRGHLSAFAHRGKRATVNSLTDLTHAEEVWK